MKINVTKVITTLGGTSQIVAGIGGLFGATETLSEKAVEKWRERGIIPMHRWLQLIELAKTADIKLRLDKFLTQ